jgi:hypothetical protein
MSDEDLPEDLPEYDVSEKIEEISASDDIERMARPEWVDDSDNDSQCPVCGSTGTMTDHPEIARCSNEPCRCERFWLLDEAEQKDEHISVNGDEVIDSTKWKFDISDTVTTDDDPVFRWDEYVIVDRSVSIRFNEHSDSGHVREFRYVLRFEDRDGNKDIPVPKEQVEDDFELVE